MISWQSMWHPSPWETCCKVEFTSVSLVCGSDFQYSWIWWIHSKWLACTNICYDHDCHCSHFTSCWGRFSWEVISSGMFIPCLQFGKVPPHYYNKYSSVNCCWINLKGNFVTTWIFQVNILFKVTGYWCDIFIFNYLFCGMYLLQIGTSSIL